MLKPDVRAEASGSDASGSEATSEDVAAQIVDLQLKADATAQAWMQAEQRAEELAVELAQARADVTAATARVDALRSDLTGLAVDRFAGVTHPVPLPFLELLVHFGGPVADLTQLRDHLREEEVKRAYEAQLPPPAEVPRSTRTARSAGPVERCR